MKRKKDVTKIHRCLWIVCLLVLPVGVGLLDAAVPGLPFTEDFTEANLCDETLTNANWSTAYQALMLQRAQRRYGAFASGLAGRDITSDAYETYGATLGDVDGDGDLDLVTGNRDRPNSLYLNNGTSDPFNGVAGADITTDVHWSWSVALGDVDSDGDLDLVAANYSQPNRLYLNNGTADPFNGVIGSDLGGSTTWSVALGDVDADGDLDVVFGNDWQENRLFLNNGTADPFNGVAGTDIVPFDQHSTRSVALGDVDGDGDLDLVEVNNDQPNYLYLNNGTADPFSGVTGKEITLDAHSTRVLVLGDVDADGDLDLLAGNDLQQNRLYLNNGTADPFNGVTGADITADNQRSFAFALGDVDGDQDLDLVAGNYFEPNRIYLNNGTANPFFGATGRDVTADPFSTESTALGDVDRDGDLDLVVGNFFAANRLYNGTSEPFAGVTGSDVTADAHATLSIALADMDGDGDLDFIAGNDLSDPNRLYLNNGTADPFNSVTGRDITADGYFTNDVAVGDVDGDGDLDLVTGNYYQPSQPNRLYLNNGTADPFIGVSGTDITADLHETAVTSLPVTPAKGSDVPL
ncbi:FG-GAP repeat domain-containing protein, partial [Acidobacteriota bacterium]